MKRKKNKNKALPNTKCFAVSGGRSRDLLLNGLIIARKRKDLSKKRAAQNGWLRKAPMTSSLEKVPGCNRHQPAEMTHCSQVPKLRKCPTPKRRCILQVSAKTARCGTTEQSQPLFYTSLGRDVQGATPTSVTKSLDVEPKCVWPNVL